MTGPMDAPQPDAQPAASTPGPRRRPPSRSLFRWVVVPAILGTLTGILVVVVPWSSYLLTLVLVISGLAWLLRVAGDRIVERAGPQRGVVLIGTVLFGAWLLMAIAPPKVLRGIGFGPIHTPSEPKDPYALRPTRPRTGVPGLRAPEEPGEAIDPVQPLRDLVTPAPVYEPPPPPTPPADGRQGTPRVALRLSSSRSAFGEGVILIADVAGDGRAVRGQVAFVADGRVVAERPLRVQGIASQIEFRLAGLEPGVHALQAKYLGTRTFAAAVSPAVEHRVVPR
jgi:hypothetical protein